MSGVTMISTEAPRSPEQALVTSSGKTPDFLSASVFAAALAVTPLVLICAGFFGDRAAFVLSSLATTVMGLWIFVSHGSRMFTATGVYYLAVATFGGLGGLLAALYNRYPIDKWSVICAVMVYSTGITTYLLFLRRPPRNRQKHNVERALRGVRAAGLSLWLGPALVGISVALSLSPLVIGPLAREMAYCGVLLTAGVFMIPSHRRAILGRLRYAVLTTVALAAYLIRFFTGYGRLNLATIALALVVLHFLARDARSAKIIVIVSMVPFLAAAGIIGASRSASGPVGQQQSTYQLDARADVLSQGAGLESVMSPLARSAELIRIDNLPTSAAHEIGRGGGSTFIVALIPWIPRSWWPEKPFGFGRELAILITPYDDGHSEAALIHGEWYFNFGMLGFLLMVPTHGLILARLDRSVLRAAAVRPQSVLELTRCLIPVVLMVGVADYVWMGAFTYTSRAGIRALLLGILYCGMRGARLKRPGVSTKAVRSATG